jgi:hypothetical protein
MVVCAGSALEEAIARRQVSELVHFTRIENLASIARHGLMKRNKLEKKGRHFIASDEYRLDDHPNALCLKSRAELAFLFTRR